MSMCRTLFCLTAKTCVPTTSNHAVLFTYLVSVPININVLHEVSEYE